jgi:hypothetical protein
MEKRKNRNNWYFADKKLPISQQVYQIGKAYYDRMQVKQGLPRHRIKNPAQLVKLFYFLYLSAARPTEALSKPLSIEIVHEANKDYVNIKHRNLRHKGEKAETYMTIPILDQAEVDMWNAITDYASVSEAEHIFSFKDWKSLVQNNITCLFTKNFITNLEDPIEKKLHKAQGIPPIVLRYMRFKSLVLEHNCPDRLLSTYFGCDLRQLREKHPDMNKVLDLKEQKEMLVRANLMPNLRLGMLPTY